MGNGNKPTSAKPTKPTQPTGKKGTAVTMKKPAEADDDTANKFAQAMVLTGGDHELSTAVLQVDRYKNNAWRDCISGSVNEDLKTEWNAINTCGFGHQKKLNLCQIYIFLFPFLFTPKPLNLCAGTGLCGLQGPPSTTTVHHPPPPPPHPLQIFSVNLPREQQLMVATHSIGGLDHPYLAKRIQLRRQITYTDC